MSEHHHSPRGPGSVAGNGSSSSTDRPQSELTGARVLVTGGAGFLGNRIVARLRAIGAEPVVVRSKHHDLTLPERVRDVIQEAQPRFVIHAAAVVGGIGANRRSPGRFFYGNAVMGIHLIHEAWRAGVEKLAVVGTICSYPKIVSVPFREEDLWSGYPEETNAPYGLAKKMLLVQQQAYRDEYGFDSIHLLPTNLYGPGDHMDLEQGHVIPSLIRKFIEATDRGDPVVEIWGTGRATREFVYVDDAAEGIVAALARYSGRDPLNLGWDQEVSIRELAETIAELTGFRGRLAWDDSRPDGQPRRAVDGSRASQILGWKPKVSLREGLEETVEWARGVLARA